MAKIQVTVIASVIGADQDPCFWQATETMEAESGNPLFHAEEIRGLTAKMVSRVHAGAAARFGDRQETCDA